MQDWVLRSLALIVLFGSSVDAFDQSEDDLAVQTRLFQLPPHIREGLERLGRVESVGGGRQAEP